MELEARPFETNFYLGNGCVIVPVASRRSTAVEALREVFPNREVIGISGENLAHCRGGIPLSSRWSSPGPRAKALLLPALAWTFSFEAALDLLAFILRDVEVLDGLFALGVLLLFAALLVVSSCVPPSWNVLYRLDVYIDVRTIQDIKLEIERATERRGELYHALAKGHDVVLAAELKELEAQIATLWIEHREARVRQRFGDRDRIIKRARLEERLERAALADPLPRYP